MISTTSNKVDKVVTKVKLIGKRLIQCIDIERLSSNQKFCKGTEYLFRREKKTVCRVLFYGLKVTKLRQYTEKERQLVKKKKKRQSDNKANQASSEANITSSNLDSERENQSNKVDVSKKQKSEDLKQLSKDNSQIAKSFQFIGSQIILILQDSQLASQIVASQTIQHNIGNINRAILNLEKQIFRDSS
ncbi:hypothetical protein ABPG72_009405 [Tetrahymena utriculariae]